MQCLACHQARHKLSTKGLENYRTHQKCTNEQKIGSLAVFKADPWRLLYSEAAADFALPKTTWNIFTPLWGDTWMGRNPHHQAVLMASQEMHFQTLQWGCKQLRFSEHFWSSLSKSSFLQGNSQSPGDLKMSLNSTSKMSSLPHNLSPHF